MRLNRLLDTLLPLLAVATLALPPSPAAAQQADDSDDPAAAAAAAAPTCTPLLTIDQPNSNATVGGAVTIRGWALDLAQPTGSGVSEVDIYLDGQAGAGGLIVGTAQLGLPRPDVDAVFGRGPSQAGWQYTWTISGTASGPHTLYVYEQTACGPSFATLALTVAAPSVQINVDSPPTNGAVPLNQAITVSGWAADPTASAGTGVDGIQLFLDGQSGAGGLLVGSATYGTARPDVATVTRRPAWANSGFSYPWRVTGVAPGPHTLYVYAHSPVTGWQFQSVQITVAGAPGVTLLPAPAVPPTPVVPFPLAPPLVTTPAGPPNAVGLPKGSSGYTISWPQCAPGYPSLPYAFGIIGVEGGRSYTTNQCFAAEVAWARAGTAAPQLYINTNYPGGTSVSSGETGPAGTCASGNDSCVAYNYGYNNATYSLTVARTAGATATWWWLDVETTNSWSDTTALNARVIQGAIDALRAQGLAVGIYSTGYQWGQIAGTYVPGLPLWTAGPQDLLGAAAMCSPSSSFAGGAMALVSYSDGTFDHVYAC